MLTPEHYLAFYLIHEERLKECLREIKHLRLLQIAGPQEGTILKLYRQVLNWLGQQMVKWGTKLQGYPTPDKACQQAFLKTPLLPKA
jgi:hypothetical protein